VSHIRIEYAGAVGRITIDRPLRFNSLDAETAQDFRRAGLQLARNTAINVVILRGLPNMFCSGADLKAIREQGDPGYGEGFK
jgi:enoyl-CoA hydratase/carnithine racemase